MFDSVLIANRGEIAVRIVKTARRLGMRVIAVYSDADADAPHVQAADLAIAIGPAPATESYLVIEKIIAAARETGAGCIHPGYGFLAENAAFAEACENAGIAFVGPPAGAIRAMGHKDAAKALMEKAGVPVVPGYHGDMQAPEFLKQKAYETGYPVLIKAVAGGGGKGMRKVEKVLDFDDALAAARREAENAFGDGRVLIEKFVADPRHIEVQVFADGAGNAIHLFERDCSLQRRHQKVMEEAPAPGMTPEVRAAMGAAAVTAAKAVGYVGAGTVEFIADGSKGLRPDGFWFMEMNTRLQVEHPVTEAITGTDLVEWQFRVAAGEELPMAQDAVPLAGHAVEVRLYAEDPDTGFLPSSGRLDLLRLPEAEGVRVDAGVEEGGSVSPFYDPMIAKVIAQGATRDQALDRLGEALKNSVVAGPKSNLAFLRAVVDHPEVRKGGFDTGFCDREIGSLTGGSVEDAALAKAVELLIAPAEPARIGSGWLDPWGASDAFQLGGVRDIVQPILVGGEGAEARLIWDGSGLSVRVGEATSRDGGAAEIAGPGAAYALDGGRAAKVELEDPLSRLAEDSGDAGHIRAPMHGKVIAVYVASGDTVSRGDRLFAVEAMKMEHVVAAPHDGVVEAVAAIAGDQVEEGGEVVTLAIPELEVAD
ncbi:ATP-binding protein [Rhodobium gokarnense]|uniref:3-methylcrotonyl-CoA carboxylase alpha subunit n=1 Tax=Rhodobium gokarnense TaxID=364296 RepID=A0ABT3HA31_9HYPH|nr:biotin carboxylase N-terminal domain-containing protein [Rhodobium gokarnense]MCW2307248.1 3-methylcrotonyl-CoA carboxylase alpha subunit [Rhodobium gokarnense]